MSLHGHVYQITNKDQAFLPILLNNVPPTAGFVPWPGLKVAARLGLDFGPMWAIIPTYATATTGPDGSFHIPSPPALPGGTESTFVSLLVSTGVPVFRSAWTPVAEAEFRDLNIWVFVDPDSHGISAGMVSKQVQGHKLPGNTLITAGGPYGLNFAGSESVADVETVAVNFNVWIAPDTSPNLDDFLDLSINGYDVTADYPTGASYAAEGLAAGLSPLGSAGFKGIESADDVVKQIKDGITAIGGSVNAAVLKKMEDDMLAQYKGMKASLARTFFESDVSVTLHRISYPAKYSWHIGDTSDKTIVVTAYACVGWPRDFAAEPIKIKLPLPGPV